MWYGQFLDGSLSDYNIFTPVCRRQSVVTPHGVDGFSGLPDVLGLHLVSCSVMDSKGDASTVKTQLTSGLEDDIPSSKHRNTAVTLPAGRSSSGRKTVFTLFPR
jgi:hypothetical protein